MALGPSDFSANGAASSQPVGNAPGQRRNNILRAESPPHNPRRWIGPSALQRIDGPCSWGHAPGWNGTGLWPSEFLSELLVFQSKIANPKSKMRTADSR